MGTNEIQELFDKHTVELTYTDNTMRVMNEDAFANAINQAELEWYKKEQIKLNKIIAGSIDIIGLTYLMYEINEKIKELENEN